MTGGVVSTMVTVWLHMIELLQQSMAFQVRVTLTGQIAAAFVIVLTMVMERLVPQQASMAVGGVKDQGVLHCTVKSGAHVNTGGCVSTSVMLWLHVAVFVQQSVASQVRV